MHLLLVEDTPADRDFLRNTLIEQGGEGVRLSHVDTLAAALSILAREDFDVVLLDLDLPDATGLAGVEAIQNVNTELPIIVLSTVHDEQFAVSAVHRGVQDYLVKWEGDGRLIMRSIRYAVERKRTESHLQFLAQYDPLTGVGNRQHFSEQLGKASGRAERDGRKLALLFLDLDNFKDVNDAMGHDVGDDLLVQLSRRLKDTLRVGDTLARLGGDEFAILCESFDDIEGIEILALKVIDAIAEPFDLKHRRLFVTGSVGITIYPTDGRDVGKLVKNADIAMYEAKASGKNCHRFFTSSMQDELLRRHELERDLRRASSDDQFELVYQPKVDVEMGKLIGLEALLRWRHPRRGLLTPDHFITEAEKTGQIVEIGRWCLNEVCRQAQAWMQQDLDVPPIAVNVSARQFYQPGFSDQVRSALAQEGVRPDILELELTEGMLMEDTHLVQNTLNHLKRLGVRLALDDFGTGYSSLSYLARFPLDVLKIDRSFVDKAIGDPTVGQIVRAIISLAESLNLGIIGEGVETAAQRDFLLESGCTQQQGFLFGRPSSASEIAQLMARGTWSEYEVDLPRIYARGSAT